jgi:hypothetical protein
MIVLATAHGQLGARLLARPRFRRQRGNAAIGRIDDERAAALAIDDRDALTRIEPEIVVAADIARGARRSVAALRRSGAIRIARLVQPIAAIGDGLLHAGCGLLGEHEVFDVLRPLERSDRRVGPDALEIGLAIRRARDARRLRRARPALPRRGSGGSRSGDGRLLSDQAHRPDDRQTECYWDSHDYWTGVFLNLPYINSSTNSTHLN